MPEDFQPEIKKSEQAQVPEPIKDKPKPVDALEKQESKD